MPIDKGVGRVNASEQTARVLMRQHAMYFIEADTDQDGLIDCHEFVSTLPVHVVRSTNHSTLLAWFDLLDVDNDGKISRHDYLRWSFSAASIASGSGLHKLFKKFDRNGTGELSELEFARFARDIGIRDHAEALFCELSGAQGGSVSYFELLAAERRMKKDLVWIAEMKRFLIAMDWQSVKDPNEGAVN